MREASVCELNKPTLVQSAFLPAGIYPRRPWWLFTVEEQRKLLSLPSPNYQARSEI